MNQMKKLIPLLPVLLAVLACQQRPVAVRDTIPYVKQLAVDTAGTFSLVKSYLTAGTKGSIAIIGEPEESLSLAAAFEKADRVDNIDGKASRDSLPDFAGESFDVVMDLYNAPYGRMAASSPDSLREVTVRNAVMAVDTVAYSNALEATSRLVKSKAKILVFSSSYPVEYGLFDVDTLFRMASREPLILTPVDAMVGAARRSGCKRVAVWASAALKPAYEAAGEAAGLDVTVVSTSDRPLLRTAFRDMLRLYREARPDGVLDAVLLDSFTVDVDELSAELEHIHRQITEEDMAFDRLLAPQFRFIEPNTSLTEACYRLLRERNLFTHNIARPAVRYYRTEENRDGGYVLVEICRNYLSSIVSSAEYVPDLD